VPALPVLLSSPPDSRWTRHPPTARPTEAARVRVGHWSAAGSNGHVLADVVCCWDNRPRRSAARGGRRGHPGRRWSAGGTGGHFLAVSPAGGPTQRCSA